MLLAGDVRFRAVSLHSLGRRPACDELSRVEAAGGGEAVRCSAKTCLVFFILLVTRSLAFAAAPERPVLAVFDFESKFDRGRLGKKVATVFRGHAFRRRQHTTIHRFDQEEIVQEFKFKAKYETPGAEIGAFGRKHFHAEVVIWGKIESPSRYKYVLYARAWDARKEDGKLALDFRAECDGLHDIPVKIDAALNKLAGKPRDEEADLLADTSWKQRRNLVKNGGFEKGRISPDNWERMDGFTTFWVDGASPTGKCVKIDTNVLEEQFREWRKKFDAGAPASEAPERLPTKPPYYDTVGGTCGSHTYSDFIPIRQGITYRVDADVKGRSTNSKIFVKGYALFYDKEFGGAQRREVYRAPIHLHMQTKEVDWEHFAKVFHPTQPLILLGFSSDFDNGATGRRLLKLLHVEAARRKMLSMAPRKRVADAVEKARFQPKLEMPKVEVHHFVVSRIGLGVACWGEVFRKDDGALEIRVRGMDCRRNTITKEYSSTFACAGVAGLPKVCVDMADRIFEKAYPVLGLRVKLDAYWPAGPYHFDNVWTTEEPLEGRGTDR